MQQNTENFRFYGTEEPWFEGEKDSQVVTGSGGLPVVKTDVVIFKSEETNKLFAGYRAGQVFTYQLESGVSEDVYFIMETEEVYVFTTHPKLL